MTTVGSGGLSVYGLKGAKHHLGLSSKTRLKRVTLLFFLLELEFIPSSSNSAKKVILSEQQFGVWDSAVGPIPDPIHPSFIHLSVHPCLSSHLHPPSLSLSLPNSVGKLYAPLLCFHKASALILRVIKRVTLSSAHPLTGQTGQGCLRLARTWSCKGISDFSPTLLRISN